MKLMHHKKAPAAAFILRTEPQEPRRDSEECEVLWNCWWCRRRNEVKDPVTLPNVQGKSRVNNEAETRRSSQRHLVVVIHLWEVYHCIVVSLKQLGNLDSRVMIRRNRDKDLIVSFGWRGWEGDGEDLTRSFLSFRGVLVSDQSVFSLMKATHSTAFHPWNLVRWSQTGQNR